MDKQVLGSYTFWRNPDKFTIPKSSKVFATVPTFTDEAYFSWGMFLVGQRIVLEWDWMTSDMFDELQDILETDAAVVWDPQTDVTYDVQVLELDGTYVEKSLLDADWRRAVRLSLMIVGEVS
jgi:hypothetical protein